MSDAPLDLTSADLYTPGFPHSIFRKLREHQPVSWHVDPRGQGSWTITRYHDIQTVLRNPTLYSSWRGGVLLEDPPPPFLDELRKTLLNQDPPAHTSMRRLVNHAFSPQHIAALDRRIAEHARDLVTRVRARGHCDFATELGGEMPLFVICEILGVPLEDRELLYARTARMLSSDLPDPRAAFEDGVAASGELRAYAADLARHKTTSPANDLVSDLLSCEIEGRRLTPSEFQWFFLLLFNAGSDATRGLLCHGLDVLFAHPDTLARLRDDPSLLPGAIEELMRFVSPVIQFRRTATQDTVLGGQTIREGDKVVIFFPSANRDAAVFDDPDHLNIHRTPNHHFAFGHGAHFCLGAPLARLECKHLFREVLTTLRDLAPSAPLTPSRTNLVRSVRHQPIHFTPC
ncbi:cytochrome P450 [Chondromyces apiculatus]|uniref:Putative cytochrome P450 hydroxylase n=1 Tax=Chondromyces apiculatus DSM 436 TaxID=1192034 RepID=A0A017T832_9BACT|nr:cytochrome P450 [Chondromyces apiculatus]EYF05107.1 putative cytochrome P450 hydroxylase [Chondromyces apiculatus DSM 436]